jgi:hypothetical protein
MAENRKTKRSREEDEQDREGASKMAKTMDTQPVNLFE